MLRQTCLRSLLLLLLAVLGNQPIAAQVDLTRTNPLTRADISSLSVPSTERINWTWFYQALEATPPPTRGGFIKELIMSSREELACEVAGYAVRQGGYSMEAVIASRIATWSLECQSALLSNVVNQRPVLLEIPRKLIDAALNDGIVADDNGDIPHDVIGISALLLENFGTESDRKVLPRLVASNPKSAGTWLAIAGAGIITPDVLHLSSTIFKDSKVNLLARVAAASVLDSADPQATEFVLDQLKNFLTAMEHESAGRMLPQLFQKNPAGREVDDWIRWTRYSTMLRTLMVLKNGETLPLLLHNLGSENEQVRVVCAVVLAIRWPNQLLQISQGLFSDDEYAGVMVAIAEQHPEMASKVELKLTPLQFENTRAKIAKLGVYGISPLAASLEVFWSK